MLDTWRVVGVTPMTLCQVEIHLSISIIITSMYVAPIEFLVEIKIFTTPCQHVVGQTQPITHLNCIDDFCHSVDSAYLAPSLIFEGKSVAHQILTLAYGAAILITLRAQK